MSRTPRAVACVIVLCAAALLQAQSSQPSSRSNGWKFEGNPEFVWTPESVSELAQRMEQERWAPAVNTERSRGGVEVYSQVAPAVVVVRTDSGHGTGFIISPDGLLLTNHHVIARGMKHDPQRSASYADIHLGRLSPDGTMQLRKEAVSASLRKADKALDLALLKIDAIPQGFAPLKALQFADVAPKPGAPATIVGHPASGLLWTLRSGQVASIGRMPADLVDFVMLQLASGHADRQRVAEELKQMESRRIILTSAGANPGDSGGPVVDDAGRVIAVTFAVPADPARAKFSYHVHLDEVRSFLKGAPTTPMLMVPDAWDFGPRVQLRDLDRDGAPDVLIAGGETPDVLLFDLDNDTPAALRKDAGALVRGRKWDFEYALRIVDSEPTSSSFYDTDNDGAVDQVHVVEDGNHAKNTRFTRAAAGKWRVEANVTQAFPAPALLKDARLAQRLRALLERR